MVSYRVVLLLKSDVTVTFNSVTVTENGVTVTEWH